MYSIHMHTYVFLGVYRSYLKPEKGTISSGKGDVSGCVLPDVCAFSNLPFSQLTRKENFYPQLPY